MAKEALTPELTWHYLPLFLVWSSLPSMLFWLVSYRSLLGQLSYLLLTFWTLSSLSLPLLHWQLVSDVTLVPTKATLTTTPLLKVLLTDAERHKLLWPFCTSVSLSFWLTWPSLSSPSSLVVLSVLVAVASVVALRVASQTSLKCKLDATFMTAKSTKCYTKVRWLAFLCRNNRINNSRKVSKKKKKIGQIFLEYFLQQKHKLKLKTNFGSCHRFVADNS